MTAYKKSPLPSIESVQNMVGLRDLLRTLLRVIDDQSANLAAILNRGVNFTENFDSRSLSFSSSGTPNAENTVAHTLGRIPTGFIVTSIDKSANVYLGGTAWTSTNVYLKVDIATVAVKVIVF